MPELTGRRPATANNKKSPDRMIDGISQKVLTESLRQMIDDGLAYRRDYHENPPKVEYGLTDLGTEMLPIVNALADFGNYYKSVVDRS